jgi:hypothetical protein
MSATLVTIASTRRDGAARGCDIHAYHNERIVDRDVGRPGRQKRVTKQAEEMFRRAVHALLPGLRDAAVARGMVFLAMGCRTTATRTPLGNIQAAYRLSAACALSVLTCRMRHDTARWSGLAPHPRRSAVRHPK